MHEVADDFSDGPRDTIVEVSPLYSNDVRQKLLIREVPHFPKPGINFYDITTLLKDAAGWREVIDALQAHYAGTQIDVVVGIEARGFIFAPAIAYALGAGASCRCASRASCRPRPRAWSTRWSTARTGWKCIEKDAIAPGARVLILDDALATGGTAAAVASLVERLGGRLVGLESFVIDWISCTGATSWPGARCFRCCIISALTV